MTRRFIALATLLIAFVSYSPIGMAQEVSDNLLQPQAAAKPTAHEMAQRQALVAKYLTPERYNTLYQTVVEQYTAMTPANNKTLPLKDDAVFRNQVFGIVQQRASDTFTLDELRSLQKFVDSPQGSSMSRKVNALGLQFRQKDLSEEERTALRMFSQTPEGQSIAKKSTVFASRTLADVMRTVLIHQAMNANAAQ